jgi:hypothetical protein
MAQGAEWTKDSGSGAFDRTYWDELFENEIMKAQEESDRAFRAADIGAIFEGGGSGGLPIWSY